MQALSNISPLGVLDEQLDLDKKEDKKAAQKKNDIPNDYFKIIEKQKRDNCKKYFTQA